MATYGGRETPRSIFVPVPGVAGVGELSIAGPLLVQASLGAGYAIGATNWLVRGTRVVADGHLSVELGAALVLAL